MIACLVRYEIDPAGIEAFETYASLWLKIVPRLGGIHYGYLLPSEGANDVAYAIFSFDSLGDYEQYRVSLERDATAADADRLARESNCIRRYERSFFRPLGVMGPAQGSSEVNY